MMLKVRPSPHPDIPQLPRSPFRHAALTTPADRTVAPVDFFPSVLPSPVNRRVGIHDFTFEACSSFTHVAACQIACPPMKYESQIRLGERYTAAWDEPSMPEGRNA